MIMATSDHCCSSQKINKHAGIESFTPHASISLNVNKFCRLEINKKNVLRFVEKLKMIKISLAI